MNNWMKNIPDSFLISEINLAGTHNSTTRYINFSHFSRCQSSNIFDQLQQGIRFLDMRLKLKKQSLYLSHNFLNCKKARSKKENLLFADILKVCEDFLTENPTEVILMSVKREAGEADEELFDFLYENFLNKSPVFYLKNNIPTLSEVRGKIVLLNRCAVNTENPAYTNENTGINLTGWAHQTSKTNGEAQKILIPSRNNKSNEFFYLQDFYKLKPKLKWEKAILPLLENPPHDKAILISFFSGCSGLLGPKKYSKHINKSFSTFLLAPMKRYGWIILDFPDKKTIKKIILSNY